jgi:hypothetical protein
VALHWGLVKSGELPGSTKNNGVALHRSSDLPEM